MAIWSFFTLGPDIRERRPDIGHQTRKWFYILSNCCSALDRLRVRLNIYLVWLKWWLNFAMIAFESMWFLFVLNWKQRNLIWYFNNLITPASLIDYFVTRPILLTEWESHCRGFVKIMAIMHWVADYTSSGWLFLYSVKPACPCSLRASYATIKDIRSLPSSSSSSSYKVCDAQSMDTHSQADNKSGQTEAVTMWSVERSDEWCQRVILSIADLRSSRAMESICKDSVSVL